MTDNKKNDNGYEKFCMLCRRPESIAGKLVELPNDLCVCRDCMQKAFDMMRSSGPGWQDISALTEQFPQLTKMNGNGFPLPGSLTPEEFTQKTGISMEQLSRMTGISEELLSNAAIFGESHTGAVRRDEGNQDHSKSGADSVKVPGAGQNGPALSAASGNHEPVFSGSGENVLQKTDSALAENEERSGLMPVSADGSVMKADSGDGSPKDGEDNHKNIHTTISMINLGDLFGGLGMPQRQQIKKKKPKEKQPQKEIEIGNIPAPHRIKAKLDEYVIGQERAKKILSVAVYNHYKRIAAPKDDSGTELEKSNILMLGPTGCGKTYLVRTLARLLDVPLAITDATTLTEAGYIGDDIESVISRLLAAADNDVERAEKGIVFIDEIDKIARKKNTNQRDVSGEAVQQGMLKLLEGSEVEVPVGAASKNAMVPMTIVDTSNILFICGGAFPGLGEIIKERLNRQASIGFFSDLKDKYDDDPNLLEKVTVDDLRAFGMIPEFLGRLPIIFSLQALTRDMLVRILKEPRNAILRQYQKLLALDEVDLQFDDDALEVIADRALEKKTGARALRAIIEEFMLDIMYEVPKDDNIGTVRITKEYLEHTGGPVISVRTGR